MVTILDLPRDLQIECLRRVPYKSHQDCKAVCKGLKTIISSPDFYERRKTHGNSEQFICLLHRVSDYAYVITVYDPKNRTWERLPRELPPFPISPQIPHLCRVVSVNRKLLLIGGWHQSESCSKVLTTVFIYDFGSAQWRRGADMPTRRVLFACSASSSSGLIYVAGGRDNGLDLASAEAYNLEEDRWNVLPPMPRNIGSCRGVFTEGNFMVISRWSVGIYDPNLGNWRMLPQWNLGEPLSTFAYVGFCGQLYVFREQEVRRYDANGNIWNAVANLPRRIYNFECAALWGDRIFVKGFARPYDSQIFYMFKPSTRQWNAVDVPDDFKDCNVVSAATVEI